MDVPQLVQLSLAVVGAVTGIVGCLLGFRNQQRLQQIKSLDLRLELRRRLSDVLTDSRALPDLLRRSRESRQNVAAAKGTLRSGQNEAWCAKWQKDMQEATELPAQIPEEDLSRLLPRALEERLVAVHALARRVEGLRSKYSSELEAADRDRQQLRADARDRVQMRRT
jgi:hypothetical protein